MPYWVRGGIIGLGILIIPPVIGFILDNTFPPGGDVGYFMIIWFLMTQPGRFVLDYAGLRTSDSTTIHLIIYFLIGALIGFIIGKIKSPKRRK